MFIAAATRKSASASEIFFPRCASPAVQNASRALITATSLAAIVSSRALKAASRLASRLFSTPLAKVEDADVEHQIFNQRDRIGLDSGNPRLALAVGGDIRTNTYKAFRNC